MTNTKKNKDEKNIVESKDFIVAFDIFKVKANSEI